MEENEQERTEKSANETQHTSGLDRRDVMKMGVGAGVVAVMGMLHAPEAIAQKEDFPSPETLPWLSDSYQLPPPQGVTGKPVPGGPPYIFSHEPQHRTVKYGWKNTSGRAYGNGPMDETSRRIVSFASSFSPNVTDQAMKDIGIVLLDTLGCAISAQNTDSIRIGAKLAKGVRGDLKSTVWGYDIVTTPEMAAWVNCCMIRHHDNNSNGMHETDMVPGILAMGEALHSSGPEMISSMILFWEIFAGIWTSQRVGSAPGILGVMQSVDNSIHGAALAVALAKLMGCNEDQMGNALSLAIMGHIALRVDHTYGAYSMHKSNHDAVLCRAGVFAAQQAQAGMTGPAEPFEGARGLWDVLWGRLDMLPLPTHVGGDPMQPLPPGDNRYVAQTVHFKRQPGNSAASGVSAAILANRDDYKKLVPTPDDIASIYVEINQWGDGEDPGKWDPLNSETADHSPYIIARTLLDWDLWEGSYALDKLTEPAVRTVMAKIIYQENPDRHGTMFTITNKAGDEIRREGNRLTIRDKAGAVVTKNAVGEKPMTTADVDAVNKKYDRICAYKGVTDAQRDSIRSTWADLRNVKDIADPIRETLARFGKPVAI